MNELQKTINYFQFKHIESNRPIDQRHVNGLIAKISDKNLLHLFPILVNSKFEIIDGQHRLAAAEKLKLYIYYTVDDQISKADIANVNALSKNWNINDYINYWTVEKKEGFDMLSSFMIDNPLIPPSTVLMMLSTGKKRDLDGLRRGVIDVSNYDQALIIAGIVKEYSLIITFAYDRNFVLAVINCIYTQDYDHEVMKRKIEYQSRSLVKCVNVKQYNGMFEEIYNHGQQKNRLIIKL
jgi:hypothetical protein